MDIKKQMGQTQQIENEIVNQVSEEEKEENILVPEEIEIKEENPWNYILWDTVKPIGMC